jgi:hypothetical protein
MLMTCQAPPLRHPSSPLGSASPQQSHAVLDFALASPGLQLLLFTPTLTFPRLRGREKTDKRAPDNCMPLAPGICS